MFLNTIVNMKTPLKLKLGWNLWLLDKEIRPYLIA